MLMKYLNNDSLKITKDLIKNKLVDLSTVWNMAKISNSVTEYDERVTNEIYKKLVNALSKIDKKLYKHTYRVDVFKCKVDKMTRDLRCLNTVDVKELIDIIKATKKVINNNKDFLAEHAFSSYWNPCNEATSNLRDIMRTLKSYGIVFDSHIKNITFSSLNTLSLDLLLKGLATIKKAIKDGELYNKTLIYRNGDNIEYMFSEYGCFDGFFYCDDCDLYYNADDFNSYYIDSCDCEVCEECYENHYVTCENCNSIIHIDVANFDECSECYYCNECYDECCNGYDNEYVKDYHSTRKPYTIKKSIKDDSSATTYGFELEVENKTNDKEEFINSDYIMESLDDYIHTVENDGSLDSCCGCEFISEPFTYSWFKENENKITEFLSELRRLDYESHNAGNCGLHFHIGGLTDEENAKIVYFITKNWEWFVKFSRRKDFNYCRKIETRKDNKYTKRTKGIIKEILKNGSYKNTSHSYFYIDRDTRTGTSELRLMRGSLNETTFLATFYMVNAIVETVKSGKNLTFSNIKLTLKKKGDLDKVMEYLEKRRMSIKFNNDVEMEGGVA